MLEAFDHRRYLIPFRSVLLPHVLTDVLVVGGGVAGARAALAAADRGADTILLMKRDEATSGTAWAQGGIAAVRDPEDELSSHLADTIAAGAGLCDAEAARLVVGGGPAAIDELLGWGMRFDRDEHGAVLLGREGAHAHRRILHAGGAATGRELVRCLAARLDATESVRRFRDCFALDLVTLPSDRPEERRVLGAITHHPRYGLQVIWARTTILATGGLGQIFRETTNPRTATGDGVAMAYRAGAEVVDLEFVQFHPTTLYVAGAARLLISEAVRGEGAWLVDRDGRRFMPEYHELAELAPRDVVARAIVDRIARTQAPAVFLDVRHLPPGRFAERFPNLARDLAGFGLDAERDLIPVHPSAHYSAGGVRSDLEGRTGLPGLYAAGETACCGLHGANRLASNSLLEGLVLGAEAGRAAADEAAELPAAAPIRIVSHIPAADHAELDLVDVRSSLRGATWRNVGIERSGRRLADVREMFDFWARYTMDVVFDEPEGWETQNLLLAGALLVQAADWRRESRGAHFRTDHPEPRDEMLLHAAWSRERREPRLLPVVAPAESAP